VPTWLPIKLHERTANKGKRESTGWKGELLNTGDGQKKKREVRVKSVTRADKREYIFFFFFFFF